MLIVVVVAIVLAIGIATMIVYQLAVPHVAAETTLTTANGSVTTSNVIGYIYCTTNANTKRPFMDLSLKKPGVLSNYAPITVNGVGNWKPTEDYPAVILNPTCITNSGYVYCIGGEYQSSSWGAKTIYYTKPSDTGVTWNIGVGYPILSAYSSCVSEYNTTYCVGGWGGGFVDTNETFYHNASSPGVGVWVESTPYPFPVDSLSCVAYEGYIYCTGGFDNYTLSSINFSYYAKLTQDGIGNWTTTTNYPIPVDAQSCFVNSGYIYCVGGVDTVSGTSVTAAYYAPLSGKGIGRWANTTQYPDPLGGISCVVDGGLVYCIGGNNFSNNKYTDATYYANLSVDGIGSWNEGNPYPAAGAFSCFA